MRRQITNNKGMTLVELMIVVAIVGILASLAGVAFLRQVKRSKISRLEAMSMDVGRGLEEFGSRHGSYYPINAPSVSIDSTETPESRRWSTLLGFRQALPEGVTATIYSGDAGVPCGACTAAAAQVADTASAWWVVEFVQDMNPSDGADTAVVVSSSMNSPVVVNEGS